MVEIRNSPSFSRSNNLQRMVTSSRHRDFLEFWTLTPVSHDSDLVCHLLRKGTEGLGVGGVVVRSFV